MLGGRIYKLYFDDSNDFYIGHTTQKIKQRLNCHKNQSRLNPNRKVYKYILSKGWDNVKTEILENYEQTGRDHLLQREQYFIKTLKPSLNGQIPLRTQKEYYIDNKENIDKYCKEYYETNKERISTEKIICPTCHKYINKYHQSRHIKIHII